MSQMLHIAFSMNMFIHLLSCFNQVLNFLFYIIFYYLLVGLVNIF